MQLRLDQLSSHLSRGCRALYVVHGDEPLLQQEAADAIRAAARQQGCAERDVFTVSGAHFDWSSVWGAAQSMGLFATGRLIEIRIPQGRPGKEGAQMLERYAQALPDSVVTLISLPRLDNTALKSSWFEALQSAGVSLRLDPVDRANLPAWIAQRLAQHGLRVRDGDEGRQALAFFAQRVEGNLLAAHQEVLKLSLLHPPGELSLEDIQTAVLDVARFDARQWLEALWVGDVRRCLRILAGLQSEGESAVALHWVLSEDLRCAHQVRCAVDAGKPMPLALSQARVWGPRQRAMEQAALRCSARQLAQLLRAARQCDGVIKGLGRTDWPAEPFDALQRLVMSLLQITRRVPAQ
jgi:DNA polymerase-3 subunit delta